jgi:D-aminopeptidase
VNDQPRRVRELGIAPGRHAPGRYNSITDVAGVRVGQTTVHEGSDIRTGVTAVVPDAAEISGGELPAGLFVGNGYGKLIGATQVAELGVIETPILLTGTLSAFRVADALVSYVLGLPGNEDVASVNPVVGETNDGFLSDIRARPVTEAHVLAAIRGARGGAVAEGAVGAGTGTAALGFKAGIGTASRIVPLPDGELGAVGVLLQANFSGILSVLGVAIDPDQALAGMQRAQDEQEGNSCVIVVAVDRGLDSRQLTRVARRAIFGMGRAGSDFAGGSGDYALAFATKRGAPVPDSSLGPVFAAVQEAVEEAVLNSVFMARTTVGYRGHVKYACPHDFVVRACWSAGVLPR